MFSKYLAFVFSSFGVKSNAKFVLERGTNSRSYLSWQVDVVDFSWKVDRQAKRKRQEHNLQQSPNLIELLASYS